MRVLIVEDEPIWQKPSSRTRPNLYSGSRQPQIPHAARSVPRWKEAILGSTWRALIRELLLPLLTPRIDTKLTHEKRPARRLAAQPRPVARE
jgi:hypothetical protein